MSIITIMSRLKYYNTFMIPCLTFNSYYKIVVSKVYDSTQLEIAGIPFFIKNTF